MAFPSFVRPIRNQDGKTWAASGWGEDRSYRPGKEGPGTGVHNGLDFPAAIGTPVYAAADGVVAFAGSYEPGGNAVELQHATGLRSRYLHLDKIFVKKGQGVHAGDVIGHSGASGIARSAAHLHFDIRGAEAWLKEYLARFGHPRNTQWPGEQASGGWGIPAEPLIPVDSYAPKVVTAAQAHRIPLYGARLTMAGAAATVVVAASLGTMAVIGLALLSRVKT